MLDSAPLLVFQCLSLALISECGAARETPHKIRELAVFALFVLGGRDGASRLLGGLPASEMRVVVVCAKSQSAIWIRQLASRLHPLGKLEKFFVMMQAYMDDSGSHADSHNCVVGGYFGGLNEWRRFERQWKPILDEYKISEFHARRFWARNSKGELVGEYKGWSKRKHLEFLDKLLKVIESRKIYPFASGVIGEEWGKHSVEHRRVFTGATLKHPSGAPSKPIFLAFMTCVIRVVTYCKLGVKVHFVFDSNPQTMGWASICYSELKQIASTDRQLAVSMGDLTFASSDTALPLQTADLIAYAAHGWAKEAKGNPNHPVNPVYMRALRNFRSMDDFWMYDSRRLTHLRKIFGFMDTEHS